METRERLRRLWVRTFLAVGIVWGVLPFVSLLFITRGQLDSTLDEVAVVINSLSVMPASIIGYKYRVVACVWLSINAVLVALSVISYTLRTHDVRIGSIIGATVSIALAIFLDYSQAKGWPSALETEHRF